MTQEEIRKKIEDLQGELQRIGSQLLVQSPLATKIMGRLEVYQELLAQADKPAG